MSNPHYEAASKTLKESEEFLTDSWRGKIAYAEAEATLAVAHELKTANDLKRIELAHTLMRHHTENVDHSEEIDKLAAWGFDALFTSDHRHVYNSAGESIDGIEHTELRDWVTARLGLGDTK